jgi:molecular chaperone HscA
VLLDEGEQLRIHEALAALEETLSGGDAEAIQAATESLERTCGPYVERRMNRGIQNAMAGRRLKELE